MRVLPSLRRLVRESIRIDRSSIEPLYALRSAIAVAIPLVVALATQHPLSGVSAALGAQVAGFAARQGVYRTRAAIMIAMALTTGAGAFIGSATGELPLLNGAVTTLWATGFGLVSALGAAANVVGLNSLVVLIVFSKLGFTPAQAGQQALLVVAGGLLQTILCVLVWPLQRFSAERRALAAAYRALADYTIRAPGETPASSDPATLANVEATLADPQPFARPGETAAFSALFMEAERLRATIAALVTDRHVLERSGLREPAERIRLVGVHAREILREIAAALVAARAPLPDETIWHVLDLDVDALADAAAAEPPESLAGGVLRQTVGDARALAGQLRAARRAGAAPAEADPSLPRPTRIFGPGIFRDAFATLRGNATLRSPYGRHAVRTGATIAVACTLEHTLALPRSYWLPLTAAIVLRPDFSGTFSRGIARLIGTLLGAGLAAAVTALLLPGPQTTLVLTCASIALAYLMVAANFALFSVGITAYVVFLLAFGGLPEHTAAVERIVATFLGGLLALTAYALWPAWEHERVAEQLAKLIDGARSYAGGVLRGYADREARDDRSIVSAQHAVRLARANAEASLDRMLAEPVMVHAIPGRAALGILTACRRLSLASLALQARLSRAPVVTDPTLASFTTALERSLVALALALRERHDPEPLPPLRNLQIALRDAIRDDAVTEAGMLIVETDMMVESVTTIAQLIQQANGAQARLRARRSRRARRLRLRRSFMHDPRPTPPHAAPPRRT